FRELYDVDLHIFKEDAQNNLYGLVMLSEALRLHQVLNEETEFKGLRSITIDNNKFYNRNLMGQGRYIHSLDFMGMEEGRHLSNGDIVLQNNLRSNSTINIHHEYGHFRGNQILEKDPDFEKEWRKFSIDKDGLSLYNKDYNSNSFENRGFVSNLATMNFDEDVAETFFRSIYRTEEFVLSLIKGHNRSLKGKIEVGISYGLLPKYFREFVLLIDGYNSYIRGETNNFQRFLNESETFLENYPNSIFSSRVNNFRGDLFSSKLNNFNIISNSDYFYENARRSYISSLNSYFKSINSYLDSLNGLTGLSRNISPKEIVNEFERSLIIFIDSMNNGDILLPINGINQYLLERKLI
ncbi:MAG: putative zinc-binding metallopeptidase, partial [Nanoarchaeota archaeon]